MRGKCHFGYYKKNKLRIVRQTNVKKKKASYYMYVDDDDSLGDHVGSHTFMQLSLTH